MVGTEARMPQMAVDRSNESSEHSGSSSRVPAERSGDVGAEDVAVSNHSGGTARGRPCRVERDTSRGSRLPYKTGYLDLASGAARVLAPHIRDRSTASSLPAYGRFSSL